MGRPKRQKIELTDEQVDMLKKRIRSKKTSGMIRTRCHILLDLDEKHGKMLTYEQCARANGICTATVGNTVRKFISGGIDGALSYNRSVNSDNAKRKVDGRAEARIIELATSAPPEGHANWTLVLLEEASKIVLENPVSRETIRRTLKKRSQATQK